jgi:hypothetical protein
VRDLPQTPPVFGAGPTLSQACAALTAGANESARSVSTPPGAAAIAAVISNSSTVRSGAAEGTATSAQGSVNSTVTAAGAGSSDTRGASRIAARGATQQLQQTADRLAVLKGKAPAAALQASQRLQQLMGQSRVHNNSSSSIRTHSSSNKDDNMQMSDDDTTAGAAAAARAGEAAAAERAVSSGGSTATTAGAVRGSVAAKAAAGVSAATSLQHRTEEGSVSIAAAAAQPTDTVAPTSLIDLVIREAGGFGPGQRALVLGCDTGELAQDLLKAGKH